MQTKTTVVARITLTHRSGDKTVIEVHANAGFHSFYHWYRRAQGRRDKTQMRMSARNDAADLTALGARVKQQNERLAQIPIGYGKPAADRAAQQVTSVKLTVFKKKLYKTLLECAPNELPGGLPRAMNSRALIEPEHRGAFRIPASGYTPIAKKWQILTGKA